MSYQLVTSAGVIDNCHHGHQRYEICFSSIHCGKVCNIYATFNEVVIQMSSGQASQARIALEEMLVFLNKHLFLSGT